MVKKFTKAHRICFILSCFGPLSRYEIMRRLFVLEGTKRGFHPSHSSDYFRRGPRDNDQWLSPRARGLFEIVAKRGNTLVYDITPAGEILADEFTYQ